MSSIPQKKTAPPGSWIWDKGEDATVQVHDRAQGQSAATPRSQPTVPEYQGFNDGSSAVESQSGEYTHRDNEPSNKEKEAGEDQGEVEEEPIKLKDVEPKPVGEEETEQAGDDVEAPVEADPNADLAENAKQALDRASENQPTNDARETLLKTAREDLAALQAEPLQSEEQGRQQATTQDEPDEPADQPAEEQDKGEEGEEGAAAGAEAVAAAEEAGGDEQAKPDLSVLEDGTVNKGGNVVSPDGTIVGRVVDGEVRHLAGSKTDADGNIWNSSGKVVGRAEPISDSERDALLRELAPFESFPDAVVGKDGMVVVPSGDVVGRLVQGDEAALQGKSVDPDGDILDKAGNVIGKAERWEPEPEKEPEPEPEADKSVLAGKRVNKAGNLVDGSGAIFGRVVEGDVKRMVGRMCDKKGNILSESGDVLGKADLVPEDEREGLKEGPFAELEGCTVAKDGTVVTPAGEVVGRLTSGDPKILFGRAVDEDGDILDRNGNTIGHAERWEPEQVERKKNPMSGRRVNREGNVCDEDGNLIGKLTSGDLSVCSGKEIDDDGDVVDYKSNTIGHCSLLEDIGESPEEKEKREQAERDKKLAVQMSVCIEQCLDSIRPICKMITEVSSYPSVSLSLSFMFSFSYPFPF
ncbi:hypothetical protein MYCTH_2299608 [Thermothelomyces thermophilus ATCC 42464]|uniref:DUF6987 domain-containing protein n=1 Tax=Thermothelomyces thermophilus (strain ATCC 42464 / BCRC 31852 / DSM 1799) TaxID=573729 RepID=G2Q6N3_THET4|nr:uncharacterized protein MYCTH_2299608 [Thermothelomyces thermophilus ATCC 42464]AEO55606.1 hypothetical protein MYCTH_2299608 [Thermothelomyces thermophilus ATCC 42464]